MLDTVRLSSPALSEAVAAAVERSCVLRSAVEMATGEELYSLTTGSLSGSWDSRVSVKVEREEWVTEVVNAGLPEGVSPSLVPARVWHTEARTGTGEGRAVVEAGGRAYKRRAATYKRPCAPYVVIEGSVHKAMLGHNVYGGPLPPVLSCYWFVDEIARRLDVELPEAGAWTVERVDWAEAYELPCGAAVAEFIEGLGQARYPRRRPPLVYPGESITFPGTTTTFKCYHKGREFEAHDRKRLRDHLSPGQLLELSKRAACILRLETSIKGRKLAEDFGGKPTVLELTEKYLEDVHDCEVDRVLREGAEGQETVRTLHEVRRRLMATYAGPLALSLFGTWSQLATLGEKHTRESMPLRTFYRHRKQLEEAGCSWQGTDITIRHSLIPAGFSPVRQDPRRLADMAEEVAYKLGTYDRAA